METMNELNVQELEQVIGGGACVSTATKRFFKKAGEWVSETIGPACDKTVTAARNVTTAVINLIQNWIG